MSWTVIPENRQAPGALMPGIWVAIQAWPVASVYTLAQLGPEGAQVTQQGWDWDVVERPGDVGITEPKGRRNTRMTLDLLYDGWITHVSRPNLPQSFIGKPRLPVGIKWNTFERPRGIHIEGQIRSLEQFVDIQRDQTAPPSCRVFGAVPHTDLRWVVENLDWGDCIRDIVTGKRMRQQVTVTLLEYNQPAELRRLPRGKAAPKKKKK